MGDEPIRFLSARWTGGPRLLLGLGLLGAIGWAGCDSGTNLDRELGPRVVEVILTPSEATLEVGEQRQFVATPVDRDGRPVETTTVGWSSSNSVVVAISNGVATANSVGAAQVRASVDGVVASATVTVVAPTAP